MSIDKAGCEGAHGQLDSEKSSVDEEDGDVDVEAAVAEDDSDKNEKTGLALLLIPACSSS